MNIISVAILKLHLIFLILVFQRTVWVPVGEKKTFKPGAAVYVLFIMYVFTGCLVRLINQNYACSKH